MHNAWNAANDSGFQGDWEKKMINGVACGACRMKQLWNPLFVSIFLLKISLYFDTIKTNMLFVSLRDFSASTNNFMMPTSEHTNGKNTSLNKLKFPLRTKRINPNKRTVREWKICCETCVSNSKKRRASENTSWKISISVISQFMTHSILNQFW